MAWCAFVLWLFAAATDAGFEEAKASFLSAARSQDAGARRAALQRLVATGEPLAIEPLTEVLAKVGTELATERELATRATAALAQHEPVLKATQLRAKDDPGYAAALERETKRHEEMARALESASNAAQIAETWSGDLLGAARELGAALSPAKVKKLVEGSLVVADRDDALPRRRAAVQILGAIGGAGEALEIHALLLEVAAQVVGYRQRLPKMMADVRELEARMQKEQADNSGRMSQASLDQYERVKAEAAEVREAIFLRGDWIEVAVTAAAALLARAEDAEREKIVSAIVRGLRSAKDRARSDSIRLLGAARHPKVAARLRLELAQEKDTVLRADWIDALAAQGDAEAIPALIEKHLLDPDWRVKWRACEALARLRSRAAVPALIGRLAVEEGRTRCDVALALADLTGVDFKTRADAWQHWWDQNRETFVVATESVREPVVDEETTISTVSFFGIRTESQRVLFVLDLSGSMNFSLEPKQNPDDDPNRPYDMPHGDELSRLAAAKQELQKALASLRDEAQFNLVLFASDVWTWDEGLATMEPKSRAAVKQFVERAEAVGATNIYGALEHAFQLAMPKADKPPAIDTIYLLSDGRASIGLSKDPQVILDLVREKNRAARIVLNTIGISLAHDASLMQRLAKENGGEYVAR